MSDNSFDSDSDDEDEEVEVIMPRTNYDSPYGHSAARLSQNRHPGARTNLTENSRHDGGHSPLQNRTKSNFPADFDARYKAMNFVAMTGASSRQGHTQMNFQDKQKKPEHPSGYPPSFNEQNQLQDRRGEYQHDTSAFNEKPGQQNTRGQYQRDTSAFNEKSLQQNPGGQYQRDMSTFNERPVEQNTRGQYQRDTSAFNERSVQQNPRGQYQCDMSTFNERPVEQNTRGQYQRDTSAFNERSVQQNPRGQYQRDMSTFNERPVEQNTKGQYQRDMSAFNERPVQQNPRSQYQHDMSFNEKPLEQTTRGQYQHANERPKQHKSSIPYMIRQLPPGNDYKNAPLQSSYPDNGPMDYSTHRPQRQYQVRGEGAERGPNQDEYIGHMNFQQRKPNYISERQPFSKSVNLNKLLEWSSSTNNTLLVFDMNLHMDGLSKLLKQDILKFEWINHLIITLKKIITVESQRASLHYILKSVCESKFLNVHLHSFVLEIQQQKTYPDIYGCFSKLVDVLEYVMKNLKAYTARCKPPLQNLLDVGNSMNVLFPGKELTKRIQHLLQLGGRGDVQSFEVPVNNVPHQHKWVKAVPIPDNENPPDDYQKIAIFPDTEELVVSVEPFLRANKTKGAYRDLTHYLDIHSRLMKEDYLSPIRTGIKNFKSAIENNKNVKEDDLRFYYDVKIAKISFQSDQGITHFVSFDNSSLQEIEWEFSKRLMFGSLLVFSKDNFESTIFATVVNRDVEKLKIGVLEVIFQNNLEKVFTSSENDIFIMAETTAYFESYRHVLEGLQEMTTIPLERYIISCMREIHIPQYLHADQCYNIAFIMKKVFDHYPVPVLDETEWPIAESTSLNDSQLEALKMALTREMAVIQGPPGTGKTYVGLKIMRILLENKVMKKAIGSKGPILVVCYTNHALDQFLEGILDFCQKGIVRVGGRSSSELLENLNLKKLRQNPQLSGKIRASIHANLSNYARQLKAVSRAINRYWQETLRLETTILSVQDLMEEMDEVHRESLTDPRRLTNFSHVMSTWLKASNASMDNHLNKAARRHLGKVIAKGGDVQADSNLNNLKSAAKTDFQSRVKIYHYWIKMYENFIEAETEKLLAENASENERKLQVLLDAKEELSNDILADDILKPYMSDKVYESIQQCVTRDIKTQINDSSYVRHWLLDCLIRTDQLLDAIEQLTRTKPVAKQSRGRGRIMADTEATVYEDRWIVDDSENSEVNTDESDDERGESEELSDGERVKMSDIKELEDSYKQFQDKEIIMLQRAKMLAIDLTDIQEDEQWQTADHMSYRKVFQLYHSVEAYTKDEASNIIHLWDLQLRDRYRLYKYWVQERKEKLTNRLIDLTEEYKITAQRKKEALSVKDVEILKRANVIGMTTTGAAKHRAVLQEVGCRIIVVEEAAEVLEAHIVTTLNSKCQHLILIGDHQQLRPSPTVHKLAVDYELEISLFERLVKNNIPHVTLTEQHRMRPEISTYLQHIYPMLQDHISVMRYENIRGVHSNVFFLQHDHKESEVDDTTSKANIHEARFLTGLCKYFLQHEYLGKQITVLAAYSGQVKTIREEMEKEESTYEFVRVTSIDNYQGEENDIILLSLVRSNEMNEVGFLKTDNRVCVALSRAKMGLFVIGDFQKLSLKSNLWRNIVSTAKENHVFGVGMKMVCVNHKHITYIVNPEDFEKEVPEGGCNKRCEAILPCGHMCTRMCHSSDLYHETTKCMQPCPKQCPEGHQCQKDCYEECGQCEVRVIKRIPLCGHDDQVPCHLDVDEVTCSQPCGDTMACGHVCRGQCGVCMNEGSHRPCPEKIDIEWPCGHRNNVECQTDTALEPCPTKCNEKLNCGHRCRGTCGGCLSGRVHRACAEKCKQPLPCGHPCEGPCGVTCAPCSLRCPTMCRHGSCGKSTCGQLCEPCMENCAMNCQHRKCTALCTDECMEPPCSKTCGKITPCKHKCMSLCGEACVCYQCEKDHFDLIDTTTKKKAQWVVAHEKKERAKKFEITKETVLMKIPKCKHIFTLTQLDRYVENFEPANTSFIRCPVCPSPVQGISRYAAIIKSRTEKRENKKNYIIQNTKVTENKIRRLCESKQVVKRFCEVDEGDFLSKKPNLIDTSHALALTMQMRFAFALSKIYDIHKHFNQDMEFKIRKWKLVISSIQHSMPLQLKTELTMEIHRLLFCEQFTFLNKAFKNINVTLKDEVKTLRAALKDLSKQQKLTEEDKSKFQSILDYLYEVLNRHAPGDECLADARKLHNQIKFVTTILDEPETEDLIVILRQTEPEELTAHSTRALDEDSDDEDDDADDSNVDDEEDY